MEGPGIIYPPSSSLPHHLHHLCIFSHYYCCNPTRQAYFRTFVLSSANNIDINANRGLSLRQNCCSMLSGSISKILTQICLPMADDHE